MRKLIIGGAVLAFAVSAVACVSDDSSGPSNDDAGSPAQDDGGSPPQQDATVNDAGNDAPSSDGSSSDGSSNDATPNDTGTDTGVDASDANVPSAALATPDGGSTADAGFPQMNLVEELTTGTVNNQQGEAVAALPGGGFVWAAQYQVAIGGTYDFANWPASGWQSKGAYDILVANTNGAPSTWWGQSFGSAGINDQDLCIRGTIATLPNGDILFTGSHAGTLAIGATQLPSNGNYDVFLARMGNAAGSGSTGQGVTFGGTATDGAQTIAVSPDGKWVAIGGYFASPTMAVPGVAAALTHSVDSTDGAVVDFPQSSDGWLAIGSTTLGTFVYAAAFGAGGVDDEVTALAFDTDDNLYVGGYASGAATFPPVIGVGGQGQEDGFVIQLGYSNPDAGATPVWGSSGWSYPIGTPGNDDVQGIAVDASNHVWVAGMYGGALEIGTTALPASTAGSTGFLASFDQSGTSLFASGAAGNGQILPYGIAIDKGAGAGNGDVYLIGLLAGQATWGGPPLVGVAYPNSALLRFSSAGTLLSQFAFVGAGDAVYESVAVDATSHDVAVTGYVQQATNFGDGVTSAWFGGWDTVYALYHY